MGRPAPEMMNSSESTPETPPKSDIPSRDDFVTLTKARLSIMVVVTTGAGFLAGWPAGEPFDYWKLFHTVFGTLMTAFGAAVFNQLIEMKVDAHMKRTADRPLPSGRVPPAAAFAIGWLLSAFGIVHLAMKVNATASLLAAATLVIYIFVYTPMKRRSTWNTIVGAVSGAIPPVIGWVAAGQGYDLGAAWLFALLFFWQMPHFYAINWIHREEYKRAGFVMLANEDDEGTKTSAWALIFALTLLGLAVAAPLVSLTSWWFAGIAGILAVALLWFAFQFTKKRDTGSARALFFGTLIYLPLVLIALLLF